MENERLTAEQSIALISQTIRNTRRHIERGIYKPFLIWGYLTAAISLTIWYLVSTTNDPAYFWLWFALPVAGWTVWLSTGRSNPEEGYVRTDIDRAISYVWVVLSAACFIASISSIFTGMPILFFVVLLMGSGTAISGLIMRSNTLIMAGLAGLLLSVLFFLIQGVDQCLLFAAIFLVQMVVPGHMLQWREKQNG